MVHRQLSVLVPAKTADGEPIWAMPPDEAATLATALSKVLRHYDIAASQKALDWGNLGMVLMALYAPRMYAQSEAARAARAKRVQPQAMVAV